MPSQGFFVTVEGPSGVGKTTVTDLLVRLLDQQRVETLRTASPSPSPIGELARHGTHVYSGRALTCLVAADRFDHVQRVISPALATGMTVLCDRFTVSSLVLDCIDQVDAEYVRGVYEGIAVPDLAIVLVGPPEICARRASGRGPYSRFHPITAAMSTVEVAAYRRVARELVQEGYPIHLFDVGERTSLEVAHALLEVILERRAGHEGGVVVPRGV